MTKITKSSGELQEFDKNKLSRSLEQAGVPKALVKKTTDIIAKEIEPNISTEKLFQRAREILLEVNPIYAGKYSLKQAIMDLGPAGYLFEQYVAEVLKEHGYKTKTNQIMKGHCVEHEVDVLADKDGTHYIIEAKYHNQRGIKSDLQTVMYTYARFLDIEEDKSKKHKENHDVWLITNTDITSQGIKFGNCRNMKITCWDYPKGEGLKDLVEDKLLYPVTLLPAVNSFARREFAKENIFFAKDLTFFTKDDLVKKFNIYPNIAQQIEKQAQGLVKSK